MLISLAMIVFYTAKVKGANGWGIMYSFFIWVIRGLVVVLIKFVLGSIANYMFSWSL